MQYVFDFGGWKGASFIQKWGLKIKQDFEKQQSFKRKECGVKVNIT